MAQALQWAVENDAPHLQAEQALLGVSHAEVGAWLAGHWHFAPEVLEAIAHHHNPPDSAQLSLTDLVHGANALVHALDLAGVAHEAVPPLNPGAWSRLAPSRQNLPRLLARVEQEFEQLRAILRPHAGDFGMNIALPENGLPDALLDQMSMEQVRAMVSELLKANEELKELNGKLSDARTKLIQSEKLASIGQLAAGWRMRSTTPSASSSPTSARSRSTCRTCPDAVGL